ncbi:MAG: glycogen/starch/alpha-glucan phosphorylase [Firmicutes bacterium]|nr:glycogen/starch/alpha-glucan phosphorylase [Bacillota bacterium]MDY2719422.1 glycogen/starch/alpha-glucan phosphorylase [Candidatus Faecousia sp.]
MKEKQALELLRNSCMKLFGCTLEEATKQQIYKALCTTVREIMYDRRREFKKSYQGDGRKQVYYMSMEFLVGTSLHNNLYNLGMEKEFTQALQTHGIDIHALYEMEPDAGLGNGGLGRLASCYMDSLTGLDYPATGFSIRYEFGIFRQKIVDGWQMEFPDNWLEMGDVWLKCREDEAVEVKFGGEVREWFDNGKFKVAQHGYTSVMAVPYNMYISGYHSKAINKLVLWSAKLPQSFDMAAFSRGDYVRALEQNTMAETISKVLYPADDHIQGKRLRLKQQYLLVSASLQSILRDHMRRYHTLSNLPDKVAIHINDTHPALCVPELMRLLMDENDYGWDEAWDITRRTLSYTNHTVMSEALERWNVDLFKEQLPRIYAITAEINRRLMEELRGIYGNDQGKLNYMAVIANNEVRMANLCLAACHMVNGVSRLHTDILRNGIFRDYCQITPERFINVTNGIAYRRWLCQSNPELSDLLQQLIGDGFMKDANDLEKLLKYQDDATVLAKLQQIKRDNKVRLSNYIAKANGIKVDPDSIFDVQIKRLHEYKRQLLNVLHILYVYNQIKANPNGNWTPKTYVFGAKASAGYIRAKQIISLIVATSNFINNDPDVRDKLKVVFIEDYRVSLAEIIIPAAEISEQISVAGKEASGTGNMKFMINGAVTIGTLDGANVEIHDQVGDENMFLFGMHADEVEDLWRRGYNPASFCTPELRQVLDMLTSGVLGQRFDDIVDSLLTNRFGVADSYMTVADFADYTRAQRQVSQTYRDREKFNRMSLVNIAKAGIFSADRSVTEYAQKIWNLE